MSKTYTLTVTEEQARTISCACEVLARLGTGQIADALDALPLKAMQGDDFSDWADAQKDIEAILKKFTVIGSSGSSLGVRSPKVSDRSRQAWDIYRVVRHRLSWDVAVEQGWTDGKTRNWMKMLGTNFDRPLVTGGLPLAEIERVEDDKLKASGKNGAIYSEDDVPDLTLLTKNGAKAWPGVDAQALRNGTHPTPEKAKDW